MIHGQGDYDMYFENDFSVIELSSRKLDYSIASPTSVPGRTFCSISFRLSGEITVDGKDQHFHVSPHSLFYLPCGYDYTTTHISSGSMYVVHFWATEGFPKTPFVWKPDQWPVYERLFSQIVEVCPPNQRKDFATMELFYRLLCQIRKDTNPTQIPKQFRHAKTYIHDNFNEPSLSVPLLAQNAGISQTYFRKKFKEYYGCQPISYIRNVRIAHAKTLLEIGDYPISEIAIQCGYENISYFSYDFHRLVGQSPSQYRTNNDSK